jgi:hypothetical protein
VGAGLPVHEALRKAFLAKHPELAGRILKITRQACELFKRQPVTVVNYLEGTRFTEAKRTQQPHRSPTCSSPRPAAWRLCWRRWVNSWTRCST